MKTNIYTVAYTRRSTGDQPHTFTTVAKCFEDVEFELALIYPDTVHLEETDVQTITLPDPDKTFIMCYSSEGMKLEEDVWYAVSAPDVVQAYGKLWDYLKKEEDGEEWSWVEQGVAAFNESHEVMFEIEGSLLSSTKGLTVCEVK